MIKQGIDLLNYKGVLSSINGISKKTRLDNNCVENRFGYIKNSIMMGSNKALLPSEIVPSLYMIIKVFFLIIKFVILLILYHPFKLKLKRIS